VSRKKNTHVVVDTRRLRTIIQGSGQNALEALGAVAFTVERLAKLLAPVDTGALRASIYTAMPGQANQLPPVPGGAKRVAIPTPTEALVAHVGPSVDYGVYQEFGTRFMAAQPFLIPALRRARSVVPTEFKRMVD